MSNLKIYRASAGSGKTFLLIRKYINLLLKNTNNFRHILAVTFTNKATNEMKEGILRELYLLSIGADSKHREYFIQTLHFSQNKLKQKAEEALSKILHNYSYFNISTIDKFYVSVFEAFIKELNFKEVYTIELDTENILIKSIESLLEKLDSKSFVFKYLYRLMRLKMDEGKSWKLDDNLQSIGKEVFKESFKYLDSSIVVKLQDEVSVEKFVKELYQSKEKFEIQLKKLIEEIIELLANHALTENDFNQKSRSVVGNLLSILKSIELKDTIKSPSNQTQKAAKSIDGCITKSTPEIVKQKIMAIYPELQRKLEAVLQQNYIEYYSVIEILKTVYILGVIPALLKEIKTHLESENLVLLPDITALINKVIGNNNAPFIYEKIGNRFYHFLIDEFQDTSHMQWRNFLPLLQNSLGENNEILLVGDVKQSIYRWRNSDWKIMANLIEKDLHPWEPSYKTLQQNYRSTKNIVAFNNYLYSNLIDNLEEYCESKNEFDKNTLNNVKNAYQNVEQDTSLKGGNVYVKFLDENVKSDFQTQALEELTIQLIELKKKNHKVKDVAILVRDNKESRLITKYFSAYNQEHSDRPNINIISNESLCITEAVSIKILDQAIRYISTKDEFYKFSLTGLYRHYMPYNETDSILQNLSAHDKTQPLVSFIEYLIAKLNLDKLQSEYSYLLTFQNFVLEYFQQQLSNSLDDFLTHWDEKKDQLYIPSEENLDAIKLLTIHKSKGLEFDVVLLPFCTWELNTYNSYRKPVIFLAKIEKSFSSFPLIPLYFNKNLADTMFSKNFYIEKTEQLMDNLNLLYVATTRCKESLIIISNSKKFKGSQSEHVGNLLYNAITNSSIDFFSTYWDEKNNCFKYGDITYQKDTICEIDLLNTISIKNYSSPQLKFPNFKFQSSLKDFYKKDDISALSPIDKGIIYHAIMQYIHTLDDIEGAINKIHADGYINYKQKDSYKQEITTLITNDKIVDWFSGSWKVINERYLILDNYKKYRPDRIMIKGNEAIILDYKFGEKRLSVHKKQLQHYKFFFNQLNYLKVDAYLLYGTGSDLIKVED